jgi:hypothetical protein
MGGECAKNHEAPRRERRGSNANTRDYDHMTFCCLTLNQVVVALHTRGESMGPSDETLSQTGQG